jgi:hypothetical protein
MADLFVTGRSDRLIITAEKLDRFVHWKKIMSCGKTKSLKQYKTNCNRDPIVIYSHLT